MIPRGWKWIIRLLGFIILIIILFSIDIPATYQIFLNTNWILLIIGLLFVFPQICMRAWRWQILMRMQRIEYPWSDAVIAYYAGLFIGTITPGRLGDFIKVQYLRNEGYSLGKSVLSVLLVRCYALAALMMVGYISIIFMIQQFSTTTFLVSTIFVLIPVVGILLLSLGIIKRERIECILTLMAPEYCRGLISVTLNDFFIDLSRIKSGPLLKALLITGAIWVLYFIMSYFFALSLSLSISFLYLAGCVSVSAFITLLPLSISGIGTRDAVFILLFGYIGISSESAVAYSVLILLMYVMNGIIGFFAWQMKPIKLDLEGFKWQDKMP